MTALPGGGRGRRRWEGGRSEPLAQAPRLQASAVPRRRGAALILFNAIKLCALALPLLGQLHLPRGHLGLRLLSLRSAPLAWRVVPGCSQRHPGSWFSPTASPERWSRSSHLTADVALSRSQRRWRASGSPRHPGWH